MTTYTSYIGSGTTLLATSADYATVNLWFDASGGETYSSGDEVQAIFQSSADGHSGVHSFSDDQRGWDPDVDMTITFSSTNLTAVGPWEYGYLEVDGTYKIESTQAAKTFNFNNLDMEFTGYQNIEVNVENTDGDGGNHMTINVNNCRVIAAADSTNANRIFEVGSDSANLVGIHTLNFTNSIFAPKRRLVTQNPSNGSQSSNIIVNAVGCSFFSGINSFFNPNRSSDSNFELHLSGCIAHSFVGSISDYNGVVQAEQSGYTSGTATDYITNEPDEVVDNWTTETGGTKTNVSADATFVYGAAPAAGEIAFSGPTLASYPFASVDMDLRLWDSTNNAASGFVSNVTLPSPDLAGHDRGLTPFDAGPYEISFSSGGSTDTRPTFKIVQVNMYN
jgi:hypothetical protein